MLDLEDSRASDRQEEGGGEPSLQREEVESSVLDTSFWKCLTASWGGKQRATNLSLYEWDLEAQRGAGTYPKLHSLQACCGRGVLQYTDDAFPSLCPPVLQGPLGFLPASSGAGFV